MKPASTEADAQDHLDPRRSEMQTLYQILPEQFRALLDLMMCSDPWPEGVDRQAVESFLDFVSQENGFIDWIGAYHAFKP
jgi:hypothetical protein